MYISEKASRIRQREAQKARDNRAEIVKALSHGADHPARSLQVGHLHRHRCARAQERLEPVRAHRLCRCPDRHPEKPPVRRGQVHPDDAAAAVQTPMPLVRNASEAVFPAGSDYECQAAVLPRGLQQLRRRPGRQSVPQPGHQQRPQEGRPPGEFFAHQRWSEFFFPKVGYVMSWTQCAPGTRFHPPLPQPEPRRRVVLRHRQHHPGLHAAVPDQGTLR